MRSIAILAVNIFCIVSYAKYGLYVSLPGKQCNLYLEGLDQFSGWFYSSLLTSVALTGAAPYKVGSETRNQCWGSVTFWC
jgi:hypothetical protein